jgi:hypothetical protein
MIQYNYIYFFSYKRKLQEMLDDEDEIQTQKRIRFEEVSKLAKTGRHDIAESGIKHQKSINQ